MILSDLLPNAKTFTFTERPISVPGDLRIAWRLGLVILILNGCRGKKASLPKLHLLVDALKSPAMTMRLRSTLEGSSPLSQTRLRIEPALGRALDLAVGEGLLTVESGPAYRLTPKGRDAASHLIQDHAIFGSEKGFLDSSGMKVSEAFVTRVVRLKTHEGIN
jgi:hypothetical protein